jgi:RNA recognition motif-containing protein
MHTDNTSIVLANGLKLHCRFGEIVACDIIRDRKTGDSLNYAFIGFTEKRAAEEAYLKMNNALIDDRSVPTLLLLVL